MNGPAALNTRPLTGKVEKRTKASLLEESIRRDIISGRLEPGEKLRLKELADQYQAGQIPLREALSRLAASGFVTAQDQRGFQVVPVSIDELIDITRVRCMVECEALADSIANGDVTWESRIVEVHYRLERLPVTDPDTGILNAEWEASHVAFHNALLAACSSPLLLKYCAELRDQTARYRSLSAKYGVAEKRDIPREHRQLMEAALRRDAVKATSLLTSHYEKTTASLVSANASSRAG